MTRTLLAHVYAPTGDRGGRREGGAEATNTLLADREEEEKETSPEAQDFSGSRSHHAYCDPGGGRGEKRARRREGERRHPSVNVLMGEERRNRRELEKTVENL